MIAYHGTIVGNLNTLQPYANPLSNLSYPCVYLSTNKALSSIYIWNRKFKWMTFEIGENGIPVYNESFENCLIEFYGGVQGYIYTCDDKFEIDENTTIKHAVISKSFVNIKEVDFVENAYERIIQYEKDGLLHINHFETLSDQQKQKDRNMILNAIKRMNLLDGNHPLSDFVSNKFPDLWKESQLTL